MGILSELSTQLGLSEDFLIKKKFLSLEFDNEYTLEIKVIEKNILFYLSNKKTASIDHLYKLIKSNTERNKQLGLVRFLILDSILVATNSIPIMGTNIQQVDKLILDLKDSIQL